MTDAATMRRAADQARRVDSLISRLAAWRSQPPADASGEGDLEDQARRELGVLVDILTPHPEPER